METIRYNNTLSEEESHAAVRSSMKVAVLLLLVLALLLPTVQGMFSRGELLL